MSAQASDDGDGPGRFTLTGIPVGSDHIIIAAPGLMPLRAELSLTAAGAAPLDVLLDAEVRGRRLRAGRRLAGGQFVRLDLR